MEPVLYGGMTSFDAALDSEILFSFPEGEEELSLSEPAATFWMDGWIWVPAADGSLGNRGPGQFFFGGCM